MNKKQCYIEVKMNSIKIAILIVCVIAIGAYFRIAHIENQLKSIRKTAEAAYEIAQRNEAAIIHTRELWTLGDK